MEIPLFLAMTSAEYHGTEVLPRKLAWMSCHFSSYGIGISNVPEMLPPGSILMLNDRIPICGHDPESVAKALCKAATTLACSCILLDFQRSDREGIKDVIQTVLDRAACPVGVSPLYARNFDCPVLVSPIPPQSIPEESLSIWAGREIWLELSTAGTEIAVTEEGSRYTPLPGFLPDPQTHRDTLLHCHYKITVDDERILFQLGRTPEDQQSLLRAVKACGVTKAVGLWQEMKEPAANAAGSKMV